MQARFYLLVIIALIGGNTAFGQTPEATPTASPTPFQRDKEGVAPDEIKNVPPIAPGFRSDDRSLPDLQRVGVDTSIQRPLTVREAIALALENNKDIEVTRRDIRIAEFNLKAARGVYEPRITGEAYYERSTVPNISFFTPDVSKVTNKHLIGNATLQVPLPKFGTVFSSSFNNDRQTTSNPVSIISPQYSAGLGFSVRQPLFRGRSIDQQRRNIEVAKRNLTLTDTQFRQRTIEIINNVQRAYWDLTYALRNLQVQRDAVSDAKQQLEHNRRLVDEGQLAPIDIVAAETQVANYEQAVYEALNNVNVSENYLKNLISTNRNDTLWNGTLVPVDSVVIDVPTTTLGEALDSALANRPELEVAQAQKDINAIDQRLYRDQKKPKIDLVAGYTSAGIGGAVNPNFVNPFCAQNPNAPCDLTGQQQLMQAVGGGGTAYSDIFRNRYPTYRVGVSFDLPLFGDKTARANYGRTVVEGEKIELQRDQIEQGIQMDVRNAIQAVRTAEARLRAASVARENTVKQYESEQRKLDAGQSDIYKVLERQTALTTARSNELRARTELNKAIADLHRATGNSLKANDIDEKLSK